MKGRRRYECLRWKRAGSRKSGRRSSWTRSQMQWTCCALFFGSSWSCYFCRAPVPTRSPPQISDPSVPTQTFVSPWPFAFPEEFEHCLKLQRHVWLRAAGFTPAVFKGASGACSKAAGVKPAARGSRARNLANRHESLALIVAERQASRNDGRGRCYPIRGRRGMHAVDLCESRLSMSPSTDPPTDASSIASSPACRGNGFRLPARWPR